MAEFDRTQARTAPRSMDASLDAGLRSYMLGVYNYMAMALALTGGVAFVTANTPALLQAIFGTPLQWVVMLAPLGIVFYLSARLHKMSPAAAQGWFWAFAGFFGLSLSSIFLAYTGTDIARTFFVTAASFGALSLWGYTTKRDLTGMGSFLFMGLIGLILASVVNIFMRSSGLEFVISAIGVLVFAGLTAYDTQKIKSMYFHVSGDATATKRASIMGALSLYLDFLNLFLFLLRFMGGRD